MNYYNQINELMEDMLDDINYIKKAAFLTSIKKQLFLIFDKLTKIDFFEKILSEL